MKAEKDKIKLVCIQCGEEATYTRRIYPWWKFGKPRWLFICSQHHIEGDTPIVS